MVCLQVVTFPPLNRERPPKVPTQRSPDLRLRTQEVTTRWARPSAGPQTRTTFPSRISASPFSVQAQTRSASQRVASTLRLGSPWSGPMVSHRS